jgi:hypothetical protein
MTDKTGHADKPGAGPFDAQYVCSQGIPTGYYAYENQTGHRFAMHAESIIWSSAFGCFPDCSQ